MAKKLYGIIFLPGRQGLFPAAPSVQ